VGGGLPAAALVAGIGYLLGRRAASLAPDLPAWALMGATGGAPPANQITPPPPRPALFPRALCPLHCEDPHSTPSLDSRQCCMHRVQLHTTSGAQSDSPKKPATISLARHCSAATDFHQNVVSTFVYRFPRTYHLFASSVSLWVTAGQTPDNRGEWEKRASMMDAPPAQATLGVITAAEGLGSGGEKGGVCKLLAVV